MKYLAEGATSALFDTQLALLNPGTLDTVATVEFLQDGKPPIPYVIAVPARGRRTVTPKQLPGLAEAAFAVRVTSAQPLAVDRTMTWGAGSYGSHAETAYVIAVTDLAPGFTSTIVPS